MNRPIKLYRAHRQAITEQILKHGIRQTARDTGLNPMCVSRYCDGTGSHDAATHYILAAAFPRHQRQGHPPK